jgi:integrase
MESHSRSRFVACEMALQRTLDTMPTLTDLSIRNAGPGEYTDGDGLILVVRPSLRPGAKPRRTWALRIVDGGKRRRLGLGSYPVVGLAEARRKAQDARRALGQGIDPSLSAKRRKRAAEEARKLALGSAISRYLAESAPAYKNAKSDEIRLRCLNVHFAPLHARDVAEVTPLDIARVLKPLAPQTAIKAHTAIRAVLDFAATVLELRATNAADTRLLRHVGWEPKSARASTPHPALHWSRMPAFMTELARLEGADARCLAFAILTIARAGAARLAKWRDIDLTRRVWSVPIVDLKDSKDRTQPFAVPLSPAATDLLEALPRRGTFLFPNAVGQPISDQAIVYLMRRLHRRGDWKDPATGKPVTAHGFRATFRTWTKALRLDREIAELSLGHVFYGRVERQYARDDVIDLRRRLLDKWADLCAGESADIVAFPRA